jgi:hypothetical protein
VKWRSNYNASVTGRTSVQHLTSSVVVVTNFCALNSREEREFLSVVRMASELNHHPVRSHP